MRWRRAGLRENELPALQRSRAYPEQGRKSIDMLMKNVPSDVIEKIDRLRQSNESRKDVIVRIIRIQKEL